jgi:hypothetical protein
MEELSSHDGKTEMKEHYLVNHPKLGGEATTRNGAGEKLKSFFGDSIDAFFHISLKNHYLYVQNPKVASSTIKAKLISIEIEGTSINRGEIGLHPDVVRSVHVKPYQITSAMFEDVVISDKFTRFCFVRSPITRVLSAFLDKIERNEPEGISFKKSIGVHSDERISFSTFILALYASQERKLSWDPHWRPQFALLRPDLIKYTMIGKFEEFDDSYSRLNAIMQGRLGLCETRAPHKTDASQRVKELVSASDLEMICEIYSNDMKFFNYDVNV